jgi:Pentapeptide repeats (8 copies)
MSGAVPGGQPDRVGAILIGANLTRARFAKLFEGDPVEAANLTRASLFDANLTGADLRAANLSDAHLSGADLSDTDDDVSIRWPNGFQPRLAAHACDEPARPWRMPSGARKSQQECFAAAANNATPMRAAGAYVGCSGSGAVADRYDPAPLGYPGAACLPATAARLLDHYSGPHPGVPPRPTGWSSRPVDRVTRGSTHEPGLPHSRPWETVPSLVDSTEASRPNAFVERMLNNAHHAGQMQATAPPTPAVEGSVRWAWRRAGLPISAPCCALAQHPRLAGSLAPAWDGPEWLALCS